MNSEQVARECAEWLAACRRLGWRYADLDFLEELWWKYHDRETGRPLFDSERHPTVTEAGNVDAVATSVE